jgi:hypothetical protein
MDLAIISSNLMFLSTRPNKMQINEDKVTVRKKYNRRVLNK